MADHKAAKKWAERIKGALPKETANLAACYLDLRELAKHFAYWPPEPPMAEKIAALLKVLEE